MATNNPSGAPLIYDQFGNAYRSGDPWGGQFQAPRDPLADVNPKDVASYIYRDIPLTTLTGDWNIESIRASLADHRVGNFIASGHLADSLFGDDRVQATLGSRAGGVFSQKVAHNNRKWFPKQRRAWLRAWRRGCPQSVMNEIMRWTIIQGFCICEVLWDQTTSPWQWTLKVWHPSFIQYRFDLRQYQVNTLDGPVAAIPGTGKWLVFTPHGHYRGWMQGAVRSISDKWFIKNLAWRDWARFNERHGLPIILAMIPAAGDATQKKNFVASLSGMGQQAIVALPQNIDGKTGYDMKLLEARDRGWESFVGTIDRCDRSIVLPILGQNLTTEVKEGSLAAARQHGDIRQDFLEFDNETLSEAIYRDIARPWAYFNYLDTSVAPRTGWDVSPIEDYVALADVWLKFGTGANFLRLAGWEIADIKRQAKALGLNVRAKLRPPTQVEAKQAQSGETVQELTRALARTHQLYERLDAELGRAA